MSNPLRIAVIGSGIGVEHIKGYRELPELFDLKILCDVNVERAAPVAEKYQIRKVTESFARSVAGRISTSSIFVHRLDFISARFRRPSERANM